MKRNDLIFLLFHVLIAGLCLAFKGMATLWVYGFIAYAIQRVYYGRNKDNFASYAIAYLASYDVFIRINYVSGSFYEISKYAIIFFAIFAVNREKRPLMYPWQILVYILVLLPSIIMCDFTDVTLARKLIIGNMTGPLALFFGFMYFFQREFTKAEIKTLLRAMLYPLVMILVMVIAKAPSLDKANFTASASDEFSAGFGSNQVSTSFGFAFMILLLGNMVNIPLYNRIISNTMTFIFLAFAILTFSRGGVITPLVCLLGGLIIYSSLLQNFAQLGRIIRVALVAGFALFFLWGYLNKATGNKLETRYEKAFKKKNTNNISFDEKENTDVKEKINFSGREEITNADVQIFLEYPIAGVGPGMASAERGAILGKAIGAHTEYTRLLAEHGMFGIFALLILLYYPLTYYFKLPNDIHKIIFFVFLTFTLFTMVHSATRIGLTVLGYGLAPPPPPPDKI